MKPGATLGLSHGFLLGVMKNDGVDFRKDINVVLVAPKVSRHTNRAWTRPCKRICVLSC
jgi:ketol-acid reductoisomerase